MPLDPHIWPRTATIGPDGHLFIGGCDLVALAERYGTPLYVLDETTFRAACQEYVAALRDGYGGESTVHYASKALLNTAVARMVAEEGLGLDAVSGGELFVALRAGVRAAHIHLHGNAKPRAELQEAISAGVGRIVVDTLDELALLASLAAGRAEPVDLMLRLAPGIAADTHAHIQTGQADSKFGLPLDMLPAAAALLHESPGLRLRGLHAHLGSQLFDLPPFAEAVSVLLDSTAMLRDRYGFALDEISPGGGLGVPYTAEQPLPDVRAYGAALGRALADGCAARGLPLLRLVIEPGRSIAARAGVAVYGVVARKPLAGPARAFVHVDGGMADNIRPALYGARYTALLANRADDTATERVHVAGRFCESGDVLLRDAMLPAPQPGDLLAFAAAGAYTLSMASTYNLVPRPPLLLLRDGTCQVAQRRETYADLLARDS